MPPAPRTKLLITGGAGFIGSNLVRLLIEQTDHEIVNLDKLTYAGNLSSLEGIIGNPRHHLEQIDLCDAAAVRDVFERHRPDAVVHLAAESHVDRSIDDPADFVQTNVLGTYHLLEAAREAWSEQPMAESNKDRNDPSRLPPCSRPKHRFLHVSTDEVYGSLGPDDPAFGETTPYDPHSPYSASKASSDHLARAWHDTYGLPVIVTNCSNNYGPYQFPEKLIPVVILKAIRGEPIPVYGKGENIRDWLYVEDHAQALLTVLEKGTPGETYNIGGNNELRNIDLVRMLCGILDERIESGNLKTKWTGESFQSLITFVTDRPGHDLRYAIDATKIRDELGWTPRQDHESGFRKTVNWYLENPGWWEAILSGSYQLQRLGSGS